MGGLFAHRGHFTRVAFAVSDRSPPDWFALLSGADYPIKPAEKILEDLQTTSADALIRHRVINGSAPKQLGSGNAFAVIFAGDGSCG